MALVTGGSEIGQSARSIMSKYSTASKFGFLEPLHLSIEVCSSGLYHSTLSYVWSMVRNHGQEQILCVSEVLVSLNDGINYLLVLGAEVS